MSTRTPIVRYDSSMDISPEDYERIAALITSEDSPVVIDAKRTHIMILRKLEQIEARLQRKKTVATRRRKQTNKNNL